jgi:septum formation inhibitor MinC
MSKLLISLEQYRRLHEELGMIEGSPLYHHTSEERAMKIMDQNKLRGSVPSEEYLTFDERLKNTPHQAAISFTRDKNFEPGLSIGSSWDKPKDLNVIFVLDRNKLKTKYKVEPFNYSALDPVIKKDQSSYEKNPELEERVLSKYIYPLDKYVMDVIYKGDNPEVKKIIEKYLNRNWISPIVNELAPHSTGVQEFINNVKETKGLLKHLGFRRFSDLEEYILDSSYKEFQELKKDAQKFEKKLNEQEEFKGLPKAIIKIFKILNTEKKNYRKKKDLEEKLGTIMKYVGLDKDLTRYYIEAYLLNYRPEGDYENLNKDNFIDPRTQKGKTISNTSAYLFTKALMPFKGSNLTGYWRQDRNGVPLYVIYSYGWYPVFIWKSGKWYEVTGRYSSSTGKQMSNADPSRGENRWDRNLEAEVYLLSPDEMKELLNNKNHEEIMIGKKEKLTKRKEELQKRRLKSVSTYGWRNGVDDVSPEQTKIKFKIKDVVEENGKMIFVIDVVDVLKRVGNSAIPTPENYLKGELTGITKQKVEQYIKNSVARDFREYLGRRPNSYWEDMNTSNLLIDFKFNHLRGN